MYVDPMEKGRHAEADRRADHGRRVEFARADYERRVEMARGDEYDRRMECDVTATLYVRYVWVQRAPKLALMSYLISLRNLYNG